MTQNPSPILPLPPLACVVLAAGQGTRMKSDLPKVLHPVAGQPMIKHVLNACAELSPASVVVVIGPQGQAISELVAPHPCVIQPEPLGTGDAVKAARNELKDFQGDVIVLFGDGPLITADSLRALQARRQQTLASVVVAGFTPKDPASYGRLILDKNGELVSIVETSEATPPQRAITLCNGGIMLFDAAILWPMLDKLHNDNAKKEYFLTECVARAHRQGDKCVVASVTVEEVLGVNSRVELAEAEAIMQRRLRQRAMLAGVTMTDPDTVFLCVDTVFGRDITIGPNVVIGAGVSIGDKADIRAFCHIERTRIEAGAVVGPFARLRPGTVVGAGAHVGNFVELKNTELGKGAKVNHLSYIGDASVGERANIGAGTITCNYDGFRKSRTEIGAEAFIGSNSALVAPVRIGDGAYVGAGSVITNEVPANTLAVARGRQSNIEDWARRYREEQQKDKK
ncbi:MAG: bifunctional UDP-N-acetylglucosamine diphosphorylase/glucosamine-1-phosphate N-acetyltransferase GlmU [Alphaproteobacteria bacterium]|nr:bifunctional UDP-N-acetylglucosamine diphosphorylase/glucosamine-1-phosphate N-acetyltransferase GlmU [Alphaproteobacteria bacterium]